MKNKWFASISILLALMTVALVACSSVDSAATAAPSATNGTTASSVQKMYSDPFAYCAAVGQIDTPDARYTGPLMDDAIFKDYLKAAGLDSNTDFPDTFKQMTVWRCMGGKVYACNFGANIPCNSKADTDKAPTQAMNDYCTQFPDSTFIPMSVTGHSMIYSWHCDKNTPEILDQIDTVDAAGYQASFWVQLEPVP